MAADIYAVWDFESGNILYAYDTEEEALDLVRRQIEAYGDAAVRRWGISREHRGRVSPVAEGETLIERAHGGSSAPLRTTGTERRWRVSSGR